jgi:hypothetical protein
MLGLRSFVSASSDAAGRACVDVATRRHEEIGHPHHEARLDATRRPEPSKRSSRGARSAGRTCPNGGTRLALRTRRSLHLAAVAATGLDFGSGDRVEPGRVVPMTQLPLDLPWKMARSRWHAPRGAGYRTPERRYGVRTGAVRWDPRWLRCRRPYPSRPPAFRLEEAPHPTCPVSRIQSALRRGHGGNALTAPNPRANRFGLR